MSSYRFKPGQQFFWQGKRYEVKRLLAPEKRVNLECLESGVLLLADMEALIQEFFAGNLWFVERNTGSKEKPSVDLDLSSYSEDDVEIARWRLQVIQPILELPPSQQTEKAVIEHVQKIRTDIPDTSRKLSQSVSRATVYRWLKAYRRSGNDLRSLLPQCDERGGIGKSRLDPEVDSLIQAVLKEFYLRSEPVGIDDLVALIAVRVEEENRLRPKDHLLVMPSRATISRRIEALDMQEKLAAQHGRRTTARKFRQADQMLYPDRPYERVEIDHTRCDVIVIDERDSLPLGRPTLTYCLDLATRYPLGFYLGFEPPSYFTVMECLHHAICTKEDVREKYGAEHNWQAYGIPGTLVVDNGKEFIGQDLSDACAQLGIVLQQCPVMSPEFKAGVERQFGTLNSGIFHTLPGTTFSNIFDRGEYVSAQRACISLNELEKALTIFLVDIYAERRHRGLNGVPARRWERSWTGDFIPRLPPSRDELMILLGKVEWRVLHPYGIELESLRYNAPGLGELRERLQGEKVKLKYHPGDLNRIYIFDPFEKCYHELPSLSPEYTQGLSLWKHRLIRQAASKEKEAVDLASLGKARQKIQEMVDRARTRKKTATRSKVARWDGKKANDPQPSTPKTDSKLSQPTDPNLISGLGTEFFEFDYDLPPSRRDE
jgi:putative transposase